MQLGNDAAFAFKPGFSARALIGLLGNDDFSFKVSPDGSAFFDAIRIDRSSGQVELPQPAVLPGLAAAPSPPPTGKAAVYARNRAGAPWIDVMRPSGRGLSPAATFRGQPHRQLGAFDRHNNHNRRPADHFGRHRLASDARRDKPGRLDAALAV